MIAKICVIISIVCFTTSFIVQNTPSEGRDSEVEELQMPGGTSSSFKSRVFRRNSDGLSIRELSIDLNEEENVERIETFCTGRFNDVYPVPGIVCAKFYIICQNGISLIKNCRKGKMFNADDYRCTKDCPALEERKSHQSALELRNSAETAKGGNKDLANDRDMSAVKLAGIAAGCVGSICFALIAVCYFKYQHKQQSTYQRNSRKNLSIILEKGNVNEFLETLGHVMNHRRLYDDYYYGNTKNNGQKDDQGNKEQWNHKAQSNDQEYNDDNHVQGSQQKRMKRDVQSTTSKLLLNEIGMLRNGNSFIELEVFPQPHSQFAMDEYRLLILSSCTLSPDRVDLLEIPEILLWIDFAGKSIDADKNLFVISAKEVGGVDMDFSEGHVHALAAKRNQIHIDSALLDSLKCPSAFVVLNLQGKEVPYIRQTLPRLLASRNRIPLARHQPLYNEFKLTAEDMWLIDFNQETKSSDTKHVIFSQIHSLFRSKQFIISSENLPCMTMGRGWTFNWCPSAETVMVERQDIRRMSFTPAMVKMCAPTMGQSNGCIRGSECSSTIVSIPDSPISSQNNLPLGGGDDAKIPKSPTSEDKDSPANKRFKPDDNTRSNNDDDINEGNQPDVSNRDRGRPPAQCFMKSATRNKNPTSCGTTDTDRTVRPLSDYENSLPLSLHGSGSKNNADLIASRGDGKFFVENYDMLHVCNKHADEFGIMFANNLQRMRKLKKPKSKETVWVYKCAFPTVAGYPGHPDAQPVQGTDFLSKEDAVSVWRRRGELVSVGLPVCVDHKQYVRRLDAQDTLERAGFELDFELSDHSQSQEQKLGTPIVLSQGEFRPDGESEDSSDQDSEDQDVTAPLQEHCLVSEMTSANLLKHFAQKEQITSVHVSRTPFSQLKTETKHRKCSSYRGIVKKAAPVLMPNEAEEFLTFCGIKLGSHNTNMWRNGETPMLKLLMEGVAECVRFAPTRNQKVACVSTVAWMLPYNFLNEAIPGLSMHMFKKARFMGRKYGRGIQPPAFTRHRQCLPLNALESFIQYITSDLVTKDMPFGTRRWRDEQGQVHHVPDKMRLTVDSRIADGYIAYLLQTEQESLMLSKSTLLRILHACKATVRKSLVALDYHTYGGYEAIDNLIAVAKRLHAIGAKSSDWAKRTEKQLLESKNYLKAEYKLHVKPKSNMADHCIQHGLSDPINRAFQIRCTDHAHDLLCDQCESQKQVVKEIKEAVREAAKRNKYPNNNEKIEAEYLVDGAETALKEYKAHQFRAVHQSTAKSTVVETLQEHQCSLQVDFAMKWIVASGRESTADWFGKRGIVWHITHAICKKQGSGQLMWRTYVHIMSESVPQDSAAVTAFVRDVMFRIGQELNYVREAYVYSDNAGAYHGSKTISSIPSIKSPSGRLKIVRWDFAEVQDGKGPCDSMASVLKRRAKIYMISIQKCDTARDFLTCITSDGGTRGVTAMYGNLQGQAQTANPNIPRITEYSNFQFFDDYIRAWRAFQIGDGIRIEKSVYENKQNRLIFNAEKVIHKGTEETVRNSPTTDIYWKLIDDKATSTGDTSNEEPDQESGQDAEIETDGEGRSEGPSKLFACPVNGCIKEFQRYSDYQKHQLLDIHTIAPTQSSLHDQVLHMFGRALEQTSAARKLFQLPDAVTLNRVQKEEDVLPKGWALPTRKAATAFSLKQIVFLRDAFNSGIGTNRVKKDPKDVAREMRYSVNPLFQKSDFLTPRQIASWFSREASRRRKAAASGHQHPPPLTEAVQDDAYVDDPYHDSDEDAVRTLFTENGCIKADELSDTSIEQVTQ